MRRREVQAAPGTLVTEIVIEGRLLMSSYNTRSERALAKRALDRHGGVGLRVWVAGLGLGYTALEALACSNVSSVEVVEFVPEVIDWFEQRLTPVAGDLANDERFSLRSGDAYAQLVGDARPNASYDVILVDVDHSPEERLAPRSAAFYTSDGLSRAKRMLAPGGVLGVWSHGPSDPFASTLRSTFARVDCESVTFEDDCFPGGDETNWLFFACD